MIESAIGIALALFTVAALLSSWRLFTGPGALDRVLALDTLYVNAISIALLLGMWQRTELLFEAALVVAMLGFAGTVALARFAERAAAADAGARDA